MRLLSLNARLAEDAESSAEIWVTLLKIEHEALDRPVRLSTDNTERISSNPPAYGTRSTWLTDDTEADPFLFIFLSTLVPSDLDDAPISANFVIDNISSDIASALLSVPRKATIHMAVVLASQPNTVEAQWLDMRLDDVRITAGEVTLSFSREVIEAEPYPAGRLSKNRYPGLHR